ncbi:Uncharacterized protein TCM_016760 [Theobroma cacao]|uniref:DUF4283 domain-containing protein n=1 Tax=Theobroma cacao TaxID=3641 RepID=A0A061G8F9_THECC|nr:Uncharacterized protein TCM_016760 [Theobroma cacao]
MAAGRPPDPPLLAAFPPLTPIGSLPSHAPPNTNQPPPHQNLQETTPTRNPQPPSPRALKKSFLTVAVGERPPVIPPSRDPSVYKDRPAAIFYEDEIQTLARPFSHSLVGKFSRMPKLQEIRHAFKGIGLSGAYEIRWMDYKHVLIHLSNEQDFNRVWVKQQWFIVNQKMRVFKWAPDFEAEKESAMVPVWISFPNLKAHLYEKSALLLIAKTVGKPLYVDEATANGSRPSVARVCVEYDCRKQPVEEIWIVIRNRETGAVTGGYSQRVEFARMPDYCGYCSHVGHKENECIVLGTKSKQLGYGNLQTRGKDTQARVLPSRTEDGEKTKSSTEGGKKTLQKEKNMDKDKTMCAEEPVKLNQRWQAVGRTGTSGVKDGQGREIMPEKDLDDARVQVSNSFQEIPREDEMTQNRMEENINRNGEAVGIDEMDGDRMLGEAALNGSKQHPETEAARSIAVEGNSQENTHVHGERSSSRKNTNKTEKGPAAWVGPKSSQVVLRREAVVEQMMNAEGQNCKGDPGDGVTGAAFLATSESVRNGGQETFHENENHAQYVISRNNKKENSQQNLIGQVPDAVLHKESMQQTTRDTALGAATAGRSDASHSPNMNVQRDPALRDKNLTTTKKGDKMIGQDSTQPSAVQGKQGQEKRASDFSIELITNAGDGTLHTRGQECDGKNSKNYYFSIELSTPAATLLKEGQREPIINGSPLAALAGGSSLATTAGGSYASQTGPLQSKMDHPSSGKGEKNLNLKATIERDGTIAQEFLQASADKDGTLGQNSVHESSKNSLITLPAKATFAPHGNGHKLKQQSPGENSKNRVFKPPARSMTLEYGDGQLVAENGHGNKNESGDVAEENEADCSDLSMTVNGSGSQHDTAGAWEKELTVAIEGQHESAHGTAGQKLKKPLTVTSVQAEEEEQLIVSSGSMYKTEGRAQLKTANLTAREHKMKKKAKPILATLAPIMNVDNAEGLTSHRKTTAACQKVENERHQLLDTQTMEVEGSSDNFSQSEPGICMFNKETESIPSNTVLHHTPQQEKGLVDHFDSPMQLQAEPESQKLDIHPCVLTRRKSDSSLGYSGNWNSMNASEPLMGKDGAATDESIPSIPSIQTYP